MGAKEGNYLEIKKYNVNYFHKKNILFRIIIYKIEDKIFIL